MGAGVSMVVGLPSWQSQIDHMAEELGLEQYNQLRPQPRGGLRGAGNSFTKIANARDLIFAGGHRTQIVKFHGDFDDDASLVLTESDYFSRLSFDSPLDVKLRADAMSRPVLFIGYSMQDLNIRLLLHRIWETWNRSAHERDRPQSYVFLPNAGLRSARCSAAGASRSSRPS